SSTNGWRSPNSVAISGGAAPQPLITATFTASQKKVLEVDSPPGSTVENIHVELPTDTPMQAFSDYGLYLSGGVAAKNVTVTAQTPHTGLDTGILVANGGGGPQQKNHTPPPPPGGGGVPPPPRPRAPPAPPTPSLPPPPPRPS